MEQEMAMIETRMGLHGLTEQQIAACIDHTQLKAFATEEDLKQLCEEAKQYEFRTVCVNSVNVPFVAELLKDCKTEICSVVSFPLGQTSIAMKVAEAAEAIENGADEIDYVINISKVKSGDFDYVKKEMEEMVKLCRSKDVLVKVIFENCYLTQEEIEKLSRIAKEVRPDYIKTSTGFGTGGATVRDVMRMKQVVGNTVCVKAAGGIRNMDTFLEMIDAGADRIGSSAGIQMIQERQDNFWGND